MKERKKHEKEDMMGKERDSGREKRKAKGKRKREN